MANVKWSKLPGLFFCYIENFYRENGGDSSSLYQILGIPSHLSASEVYLDERQALVILDELRDLVKRDTFALELGVGIGITGFGSGSSAFISATTLGDAILVLERYSTLVVPWIHFKRHQKDEGAAEIECIVSVVDPRLKRYFLEMVVGALANGITSMVSKPVKVDRIDTEFSTSALDRYISTLLGGKVHYNSDRNSGTFSASNLEIKLNLGNAVTMREELASCEEELQLIQREESVTDRVCNLIYIFLKQSPSIVDISDRLHMTERTLRRQLKCEGAIYKDLLAEVRFSRAKYYLSKTHIQTAEIAELLGYKDTSNFRSAFRSWSKKSIKEWRECNSGSSVVPGGR